MLNPPTELTNCMGFKMFCPLPTITGDRYVFLGIADKIARRALFKASEVWKTSATSPNSSFFIRNFSFTMRLKSLTEQY